jgi:hypothetical protein
MRIQDLIKTHIAKSELCYTASKVIDSKSFNLMVKELTEELATQVNKQMKEAFDAGADIISWSDMGVEMKYKSYDEYLKTL